MYKKKKTVYRYQKSHNTTKIFLRTHHSGTTSVVSCLYTSLRDPTSNRHPRPRTSTLRPRLPSPIHRRVSKSTDQREPPPFCTLAQKLQPSSDAVRPGGLRIDRRVRKPNIHRACARLDQGAGSAITSPPCTCFLSVCAATYVRELELRHTLEPPPARNTCLPQKRPPFWTLLAVASKADVSYVRATGGRPDVHRKPFRSQNEGRWERKGGYWGGGWGGCT